MRAVHLAGGRSPGRVGRASRVLKSIFLTLACASCSADAEDVQRRRVHARWGHGGEAWDGARCPPRWRPLAGPCALERARARVADALDGCAARLTAHACVHPGRCVPGKHPWVATRSRVGRCALSTSLAAARRAVCARARARARVAGALDGCAARLTAHACVHPACRHRRRGRGLMIGRRCVPELKTHTAFEGSQP